MARGDRVTVGLRVILHVGAAVLFSCAASCSTDGSPAPPVAVPRVDAALSYDDPARWLCRPDLPSDVCRRDLDATEVRPDDSRVVVPFVPAKDPAVDCFYVYPTVDLSMVPANHEDFHDIRPMEEFAHNQAARFGAACRLFAPLYRQVTIATYWERQPERERRFALAFSDVLAAFRWYLAHSDPAHRIVLLGHSQGAEMVTRLLRTLFDHDPAMRARLLVAMPIGGDVDVADGRNIGGSFETIPLCTAPDETGCVVAYRTFYAGRPGRSWDGPPPPGRRSACVNPAGSTADEPSFLSGAILPTRSQFTKAMPGAGWATTPFLLLPRYYGARCTDGKNGYRYLAVAEARDPGDKRESFIDLDGSFWRSPLGLHLLDFQLTQTDLVQMVERKTRAAGAAASK